MMDQLVERLGSRHAEGAVRDAFAAAEPLSWGRDVLARAPSRLLMLPLPEIEWREAERAPRDNSGDATAPLRVQAVLGG